MVNISIEFEWDLIKESDNYKKHQCSFAEAIESFGDAHGIQIFDAKHSVEMKKTTGSTHPNEVKKQLLFWKRKLK